MRTPGISDEQVRLALKELEHAISGHDQWLEQVNSALVCRTDETARELGDGADGTCGFGQWYYGTGALALGGHAGFAEVAVEHRRTHDYARELLHASRSGSPIAVADYQRFVSSAERLRLEMQSLARDLEDTLYNLDPLTGTPSRLGMLGKLREQHELVKRGVHPCAIAMMDLDRFKAVNDTYGHLVGDRVLVSLARYTMTHIRPYDRLFRYGGDEFLICMPNADFDIAYRIVERLRSGISSIAHESAAAQTFRVTVSSGVTLLEAKISVEQAIARADKALYAAKTSGRNRSVIWNGALDPAARRPPQAATAASRAAR